MSETTIAGYGNYPFGMRQIIIVNAGGTATRSCRRRRR